MSRKHHSLLRQNIGLLLALAIAGQLLTAFFLLTFAQKPRFDAVVDFAVQQVMWVEYSFTQLPDSARSQLVQAMNRNGFLQLQTAVPAMSKEQEAMPRLVKTFFLSRLPEAWRANPEAVRWQTFPQPGLWLHLSAASGGYWLKIDLQRLQWMPSRVWGWAFLGSGLLSLGGAILIQRRINRPLRTLVRAAETVGKGGHVQLNEHDLPSEIATVARSFNLMQTSLAQVERDRALMLAGVSHDLRTPLTKVRLGLELLPTTDTDLQQRMIRDIETINSQLEQFMDFARADEPETAVDADLNELIHYLTRPLRQQGSRIELHLTELPIFPFPPHSLTRVLQNLIDNALKYADNACEIRTHAADGWVYVEVLDRGKGLTAEELARIRQPFVRGTDTQHKAGSGLGLTIVERILQRCGGQLQLQAREGGGLQAQVRLKVFANLAQ